MHHRGQLVFKQVNKSLSFLDTPCRMLIISYVECSLNKRLSQTYAVKLIKYPVKEFTKSFNVIIKASLLLLMMLIVFVNRREEKRGGRHQPPFSSDQSHCCCGSYFKHQMTVIHFGEGETEGEASNRNDRNEGE